MWSKHKQAVHSHEGAGHAMHVGTWSLNFKRSRVNVELWRRMNIVFALSRPRPHLRRLKRAWRVAELFQTKHSLKASPNIRTEGAFWGFLELLSGSNQLTVPSGLRYPEMMSAPNGQKRKQVPEGFKVLKEGDVEILQHGNDVFYNKTQVGLRLPSSILI